MSGLLGEREAYRALSGSMTPEKAQSYTKSLTKGYTMWLDHFFQRGILGLVYVLWTIGILTFNVLQITEVTTSAFLTTTILSTIEGGVVLVFFGILAYLSYTTHRDIGRLRAVSKFGGSIKLRDLINVVRSRANVTSDFNILAFALFAMFVELPVVWVFFNGNNVNNVFLDGSTTATPFPLTSNNIVDVQNYVIQKAIYVILVIKALIVLGLSVDRTIAVETNMRRLKIEHAADDAGSASAEAQGDQIVQLAATPAKAGTFITA